MLLTVTSQATNLDCYGKAFHCVNSTHFMICVDLGRGTSTTIDDVIIPCPSPTVCRRINRYECEFPLPIPSSTVETTEFATTVPFDSEVTTFAPLPSISIPFEEYFNTVSTTTLSQTEFQTSPADILLSVKPITEGLETSNLLTTDTVITEKSISSDINSTIQSQVDSSLSTTVKLDTSTLLTTENIITQKSILSDVNATIPTIIDSILSTSVKLDTSNLTTENIITETRILSNVNPTIKTAIDGSLNTTVKPDTSSLLTTEKSVLSGVNATLQTVTEDSLSDTVKLSDNNASKVESKDTLKLNVISVNNNQVNNIQTQVPEYTENAEYAYLDNSTLSDFITTRNEQKGNTESIFTINFGPTSENFTETVIINAVTEVPITVSTTQVSSAATKQTVTPASTLDKSVLLVTGMTLGPTQDVKQIIESKTVNYIAKNEPGSINDVLVGEGSMNSSLIDTTSHVPEKMVNTGQIVTKTFQEVTVNTTITDYFPTLPKVTIPLNSTKDENKKNTSQSSRDVINHVTDNFRDVSLAQKATIGPTAIDQLKRYVTESFILNTNQNTPGSGTSPISTISEKTRNTVPVLTKEYIEASVNATETTFINTEASVNTISPDVSSTVTEQTVTNEQVSTSNLNNTSVVPNTVSIVEKPHVLDITSASKSVNDIIDIGLTGFFGTNEIRNTTTNIVTINEFNTITTDLPAENLLRNVTPATPSVLATAKTNVVSATDNTNYQELYQTITPANTLSSLVTEPIILTKHTKEDNKVIIASVNDNVPKFDIMITETVVTTENNINYQLNKTSDQNRLNNSNIQANQDDTIQGKETDSKNVFSTTHSTVPELITEPSFKTIYKLENGLTIIGEYLNKDIVTPSGNLTSSTIGPNLGRDVTNISFNNLETFASSTTASVISAIAEHIVKDPQSDADSIGNDINNQVGNITNRLAQNEKNLSTNDADNKPSAQVYISNSDKIESTTFNALLNEPSTTMLKLLLNEAKTKVEIAVNAIKLSEVNIHNEPENKPSTESAILPTESLLSTPAVNESSISTKYINKINSDTSMVWYDNSSVARLDGQTQAVTDGSLTPTIHVTDRTHIDSLPSINEYTDKAISRDQYYKVTVPGTEITTLFPSIEMVDQNKNVSSEIINTLQQTSSISMNTSTSMSSTTIAITEAAYVSSDYNYIEKTSFHDETTINSTTDQTEKPTEPAAISTQSTDLNKASIKNIDEFAVKRDVTHTFLDMPPNTNSSLEPITPRIIKTITLGNIPTSTTIKNNGYLSTSSDALINTPSTTSTLSQAHIDQNLPIQNIKTGNLVTEPSIISFDIGSNMHPDESTKPFSITENLLDKINNSMKNNSSTLSNSPRKGQESVLSTEYTKSDLSTLLSTSENYVAMASPENGTGITTDIPVIENSSIFMLKEEVTGKYRLPTETNISEKNISISSNLSSTNQNTVIFDKHSQRDTNTSLTKQAHNEEVISAATTKIPMIINSDSYQNSTIKDSMNKKPTDVHVNANNSIHQTNPLENITLNTSSSVASTQESLAYITLNDSHQTNITTGIGNNGISTSTDSQTLDKNTRTTAINSIADSLDTLEIKLNGQINYISTTSNLNKEDNKPLMDYSITPITIYPGLVKSTTTPMQTNIAPISDNINAQKRRPTQTDSNLVSVNPNIVSQYVRKYIGKDVPDMAEITPTVANHIIVDTKNTDIASSATNESLPVTLLETDNSNSTITKPTLTSNTLPIEFNTSFKQKSTTVSSISMAITQPINVVDLSQTQSTASFITKEQGSQISLSHLAESVISTAYASLDIKRQVPSKTAENTDQIPNIEPTIGPVKRDLDNIQVFIDNKKIKTDDENPKVATFSTGQSTETLIKEANTNIYSIKPSTEMTTRPETTRASTIQITVSGIQSIEGIKDNDQFSSFVTTSDFGVPSEVITASDVLVDSKIEREKTHSGIISFITPPPKRTKERPKKKEPETKETEAEGQQEHPINVELASVQDRGLFTLPTDIPLAPEIENGNKVQNDISKREESLIKHESNNFKTTNGTETEQRFAAQNNPTENIPNGTNTTASGYKNVTPTHELIENSKPPTNDSHTSNNKSQDQNMSIPQAHNKSVISNDQSSTSRYTPQTKSTAAADTQTTGFPELKLTTQKTETNNFCCKQKKRGRYADELDCRKFYICPGNKSSHIIKGTCPVNTVFSKVNKQCTKNLSHCIRNNQFRCVTEGRFSDFLNDNIYYICVKNNLSHFIRFKLQCLNGYFLNKTSVRCVLNNESTSTSESKSTSEQSSSAIKQDITEKPEKKFNCKKEGVFPDPSNCEKYFECTKEGSSYRQKKKHCDGDEIFHKDKKKCVDADSYEC